jgi:hypothetical protein
MVVVVDGSYFFLVKTDFKNLGKRRFGNLASILSRVCQNICSDYYSGADKSLARPERKQTTATEEFEFHISYL